MHHEGTRGTKGEANGLPEGWVWTNLAAISSILRGVSYKKEDARETLQVGHLPILRATNIQDERLVTDDDLVYVPDRYVSPEQLLKPNDIVICMSSGSKHLVGKAAQLQHEWQGSFGTFCGAVRPNPEVDPRYLGHYFSSPDYREFIRAKSSGININNLRRSDIAELRIPLAPLAEQSRIVSRVEELLTRLDAGVAGLKRVQVALKRYRAAVLKAACEGRLVPQDPNDEPAAKQLGRILAERRAKWAADLRAKGKDPAKAKYEEPQAPETEGLPALPEGWCWATVEQVADRIVDCLHSTPRFSESGYYCVDSNWIKPGQIVFERARHVDEATFLDRNRRMVPRENDVIFSREGARLGVAVRLPAGLQFCLGQRMMIFRLSACANSEYFEKYLNSPHFQAQYAPLITGTAAPHLNIGDIRGFHIPLPPIAEQHRVAAEVERRLSVVDAIEQAVTANLGRAERLRQAVLRRAFEGKLVMMDGVEATAL